MHKLKEPLPRSEWTIETPFDESITIGGLNLSLLGMTASHPIYGAIQASSVARDGGSQTAEFELFERITTLIQMHDQPELFPGEVTPVFRPARSNGIALHETWTKACERAAMELVERHVTLQSWIGLRKPQRLDQKLSIADDLSAYYDCRIYLLGEQKVSMARESMQVVTIMLWPKSPTVPLAMGFGTGFSIQQAIQKAENEALQRLAFLWGEEIPSVEPQYEASHYYHSEYYLYPPHHSILHEWLDENFDGKAAPASLVDVLKISFIDITAHDSSPYWVAKAVSKDALPLYFGRYLEGPFTPLRGTKREVHPIP